MTKIQLPNGWRPRPYQLRSWTAWERGALRQLLVWHRRAGKDDVALHKAAVASHMRIGNYWHMLPEYAQARKAIWNAVNPHTGKRRIDEAFPHELRANTNDNEMFIRFKNGSTWQVVGSDRYDSLVGTAPIGVVSSEFALADPRAWGFLAPILNENGGWADFITTPRGKNHVYGLLQMAKKRMREGDDTWFAEVLPVSKTGAVSQERIEDDRETYISLYGKDVADGLIQQEYYCSFDEPILGAYWGKDLARADQEGRVTELWPSADVPVHTAWDLGIGDATAIWFWQSVGGEIWIVDYLETHGVSIADNCATVQLRAQADGYRVGDAWLPHDAKVREMGTGKTRVETVIESGLTPRLVPDHLVMDGINAVRGVLHRCWFDEGNCEKGLENIRNYRSRWSNDRKMFVNEPLHDYASHAADAFRYMAMAWRTENPTAPPPRAPQLQVGPGNEVSLEHIYAGRQRASQRI